MRGSRFEQVVLNPQPLPPKGEAGASHSTGTRSFDDGNWCGSVPKHLNFPPPRPPWADSIGQPVSFQVLNAIAAGGR